MRNGYAVLLCAAPSQSLRPCELSPEMRRSPEHVTVRKLMSSCDPAVISHTPPIAWLVAKEEGVAEPVTRHCGDELPAGEGMSMSPEAIPADQLK